MEVDTKENLPNTNAEQRSETFFPELFQEGFSEFEGNFPQATINNCFKNSYTFCTFADDSRNLNFAVLLTAILCLDSSKTSNRKLFSIFYQVICHYLSLPMISYPESVVINNFYTKTGA
jgi:hypothetical protein